MTRKEIIAEIQDYLDKHSCFRVVLGHYDENYKWVPLQTKRINLKEVFGEKNSTG